MNCKPGDLVIVRDTFGSRQAGLVDRFFRVTQLLHPNSGEPLWLYEGELVNCGCGCNRRVNALADDILRPVRDPGDDARDEMLRPLPADANILETEAYIGSYRRHVEAFQ